MEAQIEISPLLTANSVNSSAYNIFMVCNTSQVFVWSRHHLSRVSHGEKLWQFLISIIRNCLIEQELEVNTAKDISQRT